MVLVCDTSSYHDNHLCQIILNPTMHFKVMGRTRTGFTEVYAQSLSADCDFELWPNDMVLVRDTSSCHNDHLCQIIFKSYHVQLMYGPNTILEHTNTYTHMDRVNSICTSTIWWRGHKKITSPPSFHTLPHPTSISSCPYPKLFICKVDHQWNAPQKFLSTLIYQRFFTMCKWNERVDNQF